MGTKERKEREKAERKALILRCAKELILKYGLDGVNMTDIAEKAELSKGTLYIYFTNKEELLREICDEAAQKFIKHFYERLKPGLSALETIKLYWLCYIDMFGKSNDMVVVFNMKNYIASSFPFNPFEEQRQDSPYVFYTMIEDMIKQGIDEKVFDPNVNPSMVARTMLSLFSYIVENIVKMSENGEKAKYIINELKHIFEIFLRGIAHEDFDRSQFSLPMPTI